MKRIPYILAFFILCMVNPSWATTYYVRTDGGTGTQCTGTTDAAYPGSGTGQACGFNHPNWPLPAKGQPTTYQVSSGDTVVIHGPEAGTGSYRMGCQDSANCLLATVNMVNSTNCSSGSAADCAEITPPSGTSGSHVKIVGCSADGCGTDARPELWLAGRANRLFNIASVSYVDFDSLEITDHAAMGEEECRAITQDKDNLCGFIAFEGANNWHHLTWTKINIHGLAVGGFKAAGQVGGTDMDSSWTDVDIVANGGAGYNGDTCDNQNTCPHHGTFNLTRVRIEWNGCTETYPLSGSYPYLVDDKCKDSNVAYGYGDGWGTSLTYGIWTFDQCNISHNMSDGLDFLYLQDIGSATPALLTIKNSRFEGNMGNAIKTGGSTTIENSLIINNCNYFEGKAYTHPSVEAADSFCRAGDCIVVREFDVGGYLKIYNTSFLGSTDAKGYSAYICRYDQNQAGHTASDTNGTEIFSVRNTIFDDTPEFYNTGNTVKFWGDGPGVLTSTYDIFNPDHTTCPTLQTGSQCDDPELNGPFTGYDVYQGSYISVTSPARDAADETVPLSSAVDYNYYARGASWDVGALEYGSTPSGPSCDTDCSLCLTENTCSSSDATCYWWSTNTCETTEEPPPADPPINTGTITGEVFSGTWLGNM